MHTMHSDTMHSDTMHPDNNMHNTHLDTVHTTMHLTHLTHPLKLYILAFLSSMLRRYLTRAVWESKDESLVYLDAWLDLFLYRNLTDNNAVMQAIPRDNDIGIDVHAKNVDANNVDADYIHANNVDANNADTNDIDETARIAYTIHNLNLFDLRDTISNHDDFVLGWLEKTEKNGARTLDLYMSVLYNYTPMLDLSFLQKCDRILSVSSNGPLNARLHAMKRSIVAESLQGGPYRTHDSTLRLHDVLGCQAVSGLPRIPLPRPQPRSHGCIVLDSGASLYTATGLLFGAFVERFQLWDGKKKRKRGALKNEHDFDSGFVRLEFGRIEIESCASSVVQVSPSGLDQVPTEVVGQEQVLLVQESGQFVESAPKKRKKFEKMRSSARLKQDEAPAAHDPAQPDQSASEPTGKIDDLSFISDYLPPGLLAGYTIAITSTSLKMVSCDGDLNTNTNMSVVGIDCAGLLERVERDILSSVASRPAKGAKRGRHAKGRGEGGEKAVIIDLIFPSNPVDSAGSDFFRDGEAGLVDKFQTYLGDKVVYSYPQLGLALLLFVVREYATTATSAFWTPQISQIAVLWIQCLCKFGGIRLDHIFLQEVVGRVDGLDVCFVFRDLGETMLCLVVVCEVLLDCLTDRNGSVSLDIYDEIGTAPLAEETGKNVLESTCKKSVFDAFYAVLGCVLDKVGDGVDGGIRMRALWISARVCEINGDAGGAVDALRACALFFEEQANAGVDAFQTEIVIPHYMRDGVIGATQIQDKIDYFELKVQIEETEDFFNNGDFEMVVDRLEPLFLGTSIHSHSRGREIGRQMPPEKRLTFLKLLRESSFRLGRFTTWLSTVVECIAVTIGTMESGVLDISENIENLATFILDLNHFIQDHSHWRSFIQNMHDFTFLVLVSLHVSWKLVMCVHSLPKTPKTTHTRKLALIKSFAARAWILFYHLVVDKYNADNEEESDWLSGILEWVHDQLGSVELCGGDEGELLKVIVHHLSKSGPEYYHEIYQCYSCLYGTVIKIGSNQELLDHHCSKTEFGKEAAEFLYRFISPVLLEKVEAFQFRTITKDMVDCLTKVLDVFPSPPMQDRYVAVNAAALERLLKTQINPLLALPNQRQSLAMLEIPEQHVLFSRMSIQFLNLVAICKTVFYLFGKIQLNNFFTKPDKAADFLVSAIQHLTNHVLLSPNDLNGWVALANAYSSTANEILGRTVIEYREKRRVIDAQRAGFHCYVRALKLYSQATLSEDENVSMASLLWNNFALHCRAIISAPMESVALKNETIAKLSEMAGETKPTFKESEYLATTTKQLFSIIAMSFKRAIQIDPSWSFFLCLAHAYRKLKKDPSEIIRLYLRGIRLMPSENITKDQDLILDPIYKCISYVLKANYDSILSETGALKAFKDLKELYPPLEENAAKMLAKESTDEAVLLPQNDVLREGVLLLQAIKRIDKKKWYHRPYYRIAWVWSVVEKEQENAKEELSLLLNIKTKLRRIWKTDLEVDGRHFVYFSRYISMLIDLAQKTSDIPLLVLLCKRLLVEENLISKIQVRNDARKALLSCISSLQGNPNDQSFKRLLESVPIIDPDVEKLIVSKHESTEENEVHRLVIACDLKRARKQSENALEKFILNVYSKLYLQALGSLPPAKKIQYSTEKESKMAGKILLRALHLTKSIVSSISSSKSAAVDANVEI